VNISFDEISGHFQKSLKSDDRHLKIEQSFWTFVSGQRREIEGVKWNHSPWNCSYGFHGFNYFVLSRWARKFRKRCRIGALHLWHLCMIFISLFYYCDRQNLDRDVKSSPFEIGVVFALFWPVA
jgi:hypothetical protein